MITDAINFKKQFAFLITIILCSTQLNAQITSYPYIEDFESGWGSWSIASTNGTTWEYGTPNNLVINSAASGSNAFATNLTGNYNPEEDGFLQSPQFDFSAVSNPIVEFSLWWQSEGEWDGAVLQSSSDLVNWQNVGTVGTGSNWYNTETINGNPGGQSEGWSGSTTLGGEASGGWVTVSHPINNLAGQSNVYFRLAFGSDPIIQDEGFAFDDFKIIDLGSDVVSIPDPEFEQGLIDEGIDSDGIINGQVFLSDIYFVNQLELSGYDIASFEGLQFFNSLLVFNNFNNNAPSIDLINFSGNLLLEEINIVTAPGLSEINVNQNTSLNRLQVFTDGTLFNDIDVSANINLTFLGLTSNAITNLDIQNNNLIESLFVNNNPINNLDVTNLTELNLLVTNLTNIESLDLSGNAKLATLLADDSALKEVNLQSGSNDLITYLDVRNNPELCAILVDDVSFSAAQSDWFKDPTSSYFDASTGVLTVDQFPEDLILNFDVGYEALVNEWLNNNGNGIVTAECGEVTWAYEVFDTLLEDNDFNDTFERLVIFVSFFVYDDFDGSIVLERQIIFNDFASAGESAGNGGTICENRYPISNFDDDISFPGEGANYESSKYSMSTFEIDQVSGKPGLVLANNSDVEFPDTGAGQFTYFFRFDVATEVTIGTQNFSFETSTFYTANNVTVAFEPGPNITVERCDFNSIDLLNLYNELEIELDVDLSIYNEAEDFGNVFEPENSWYNETDDLEANPNTPSLTEITEPGVYQFNAKKFLEDCAGEPVFVTIIPEPLPDAGNSDVFVEDCLDSGLIDLNQYRSITADEDGSWESLDGVTISNNSEIDIPSANSGQTFSFIYKVINACGVEDEAQIDIELNFAELVDAGDSLADITVSPGVEDLNSYLSNTATVGGSWSGDLSVEDGTVEFPDTGAGQFSYGFSYTVDNGCGTIDIATFDFIVDIPANAGLNGNLDICSGTTITESDLFNALNGTPQTGGTWTPVVNGAGVYTYTISESQGDSATVTVTEQTQLLAGEDGTLEINPGDTLTEMIMFNALEGSPDPGGVWSPELSGVGVYTYAHSAGICPESSATVTVTEVSLSISEFDLTTLYIFPNPTSQSLNVKGDLEVVDSMEIFAITGQVVQRIESQFDQIDVSSLERGIYFLKINASSKETILKFVKN